MSVRHASKSMVDVLTPCRTTNYVCRQCRRNARLPTSLNQQRRFASKGPEGLPFAEKVRRKLWKGKPPGPENVDDLYGGPGALETIYRRRKEDQIRSKSQGDPEISDRATSKSAMSEDSAVVNSVDTSTLSAAQESQQNASTTLASSASAANDGVITANNTTSTDYEQATTWDGLQFIGDKGHWKEINPRPQDQYNRWLESPVRPAWSYSDLVSLMHQSIVECHSCKQANLDPAETAKLNASGPLSQEQLEEVSLSISPDGQIEGLSATEHFSLERCDQSMYRSKLEGSEPVSAIAEESIPTPLEPRLLYIPADATFMDASLKVNDSMTFAILKRFTVLTNHTLPDPLINDFASSDPTKNTIRAFLTAFARHIEPKPANLAERLMQNQTLAKQSNLLILGRRETPVDKEKEVGRWKVIEEELKARGLPVLGKLQIQR